ncbi:hypothetical protein [Bradyrhizobium manausense]|uniref:Uncharacterized protein n=1 Tax=Bradyrhizobium manausense TaxID=989370 RepID=A0A0R3D0V6_9BRAD|nr:hypothetical protein [Bradyrhizobium manausense]KRQ03354.1 hypothetical protein AOQ71_32035 [Bradyrhizobium manausense]
MKSMQPTALAIIGQIQAISRFVDSPTSQLHRHELMEIGRALSDASETVVERTMSPDTIGPDRGRAA